MVMIFFNTYATKAVRNAAIFIVSSKLKGREDITRVLDHQIKCLEKPKWTTDWPNVMVAWVYLSKTMGYTNK